MKLKVLNVISGIFLLSLILSSNVLAQNKAGHCSRQEGKSFGPHNMIANLSEDQQKKIDALHLKHMKEVTDLKNQIMLKKAELRILETSEKPDKASIDKKIDEIMALKTQIAKKHAALKQEIRALLTEEQRIIFDSHKGRGPKPGCLRGNDDDDDSPGPKPQQGPVK